MAKEKAKACVSESQPIYLGIDAHKNSWSFTVIQNDQVLERKTLRADVHLLRRFLGRYQGKQIQSAYEAGYCGFQLHYWLTELGVLNRVVAVNKMPTLRGDRVKTDKRDSLKLATFLAKGLLKPIFIPSPELIRIRELVRLRSRLVGKRTSHINQLKALLVKHGIVLEFSGYAKKKLQALLDEPSLPEELRLVVLMHIQSMELITQQLLTLEQRAEQIALTPEYERNYQILRSIPGIGTVSGRALLFEIGDFNRFPNEKTIAAFCGLTPSEYSSGESILRGRITGQGNTQLRQLLIQASWQAIAQDQGFKNFFERVACKTGNKKKAIVAVARKLLCVSYALVKQQQLYDRDRKLKAA
jgi:transposase